MIRGTGATPGVAVTSRRPGRQIVLRPAGGRTGRAESRADPYRPTYAGAKERKRRAYR